MGRPRREAIGGLVYHVLNRGNARMTIFEDDADYAAFERVLAEGLRRYDVGLCCYCLMPNHWHLVVLPGKDGELSRFVGWVTLTHTQRWHAHRHSVGQGHVYQGRFKSFPTQSDEHFLALARYVERNALRAGKVKRAEDWPWCSLWRRCHPRPRKEHPGKQHPRKQHPRKQEGPTESGDDAGTLVLCRWPVDEPRNWLRTVNAPQSQAELDALRRCVNRGQPFGGERWVKRVTRELGLESTFRPRGRPRKGELARG